LIAHRCPPCDACGVAAALALTAPSLALLSTRLPGRNGPSRSSAKHRCRPALLRADHRPSLWLHFGAPVYRPARLTPSASHGVGRRKPARTGTSAPRPSIDHPLRDASREVTVRVNSRMGSKLLILRLRDANPEVMFRPRGFAPPRRLAPRDGSRACCIPLPTMGFVSFPARQPEDLRISRDAYHPSKNSPDPPWALRSPGALAPLMFLLVPPVSSPRYRFRHRGSGGIVEAATFEAFSVESVRNVVARFRAPAPCPSWASDSSSRSPRTVACRATPSPGLDFRRAHRPRYRSKLRKHRLARCQLRGLQTGEPGCDLHEVWYVKERSEEHSLR